MLALGAVMAMVLMLVLLARPWKRRSPRHEFMLDLYTRMLGETSVGRKALSPKRGSSLDSLRRAG